MFGENGFCDNGAQTPRPKQPQKSRDQMDYENKQMAHKQIIAGSRTPEFSTNYEFATHRRILASR